jgi:antitoxin (DNA-binding transcriptional repressor) of toxin-antitoxin stability system
MLKVNIHEAKTHLSRYAKRVKAGETVLLCDRNKPFAEIRPYGKSASGKPAKRRMGQDEGKVLWTDDWDSPETNAAIAALFGVGVPPTK